MPAARPVQRLRGLARRVRRRIGGQPARVDKPDAPEWLLRPVGPTDDTPGGPTVVLLDDTRDQLNFGAAVLVDGLFEILQRADPSATIVPIPSFWLIPRGAAPGAFVPECDDCVPPRARWPRVADEFEAVADAWSSSRPGSAERRILSRFEGADLVVLNGEGSVYRDNESAIRELFLVWMARTRLGIPSVFVNGTVHLTDVVPVLPAMVRKVLPTLDAVAVREPCSLRNLATVAPGLDVDLFPDSAFVFGPGERRVSPAVDAIRRRIGADHYFCFDPGPMPMDDGATGSLRSLIEELSAVAGRPVMVASAPSDRSIEAVARAVDAVYVDDLTDYREFMALVEDAQLLVSGRYHNPILAAIVGCPSITVGSTNHKVHGACEILEGLNGSPFDGTDLRTELDAIVARATELVGAREQVRQDLLAVCDRRRSEAIALGTYVMDRVRQPSARP